MQVGRKWPCAPGVCSRLTLSLEDTEDLVASHRLDLGDTVRIPEGDADLGRSETLLGELGDAVDHLGGADLEPGGGGPAVRLGRPGDTLSAQRGSGRGQHTSAPLHALAGSFS